MNAATWIELNARAFHNNVSFIHQCCKKPLAAVVKARAYGHGLIEIARLCEENSLIKTICVATVQEAQEVRGSGCRKPILVLVPDYTALNDLVVDDTISFSVSHREYAQALITCARKKKVRIPIHIKIDTGLSRFGFLPEQFLDFYSFLSAHSSELQIKGIYSHFAQIYAHGAVTPYSREQYASLCSVIAHLRMHNSVARGNVTHDSAAYDSAAYDSTTYDSTTYDSTYDIHMSNTTATLVCDMPLISLFRVGIGLYGIEASISEKKEIERLYGVGRLQSVLTWKTRIIELRTIKEGVSIGYGCSYYTSRPTIIAMIPVGYSDGYSFSFSHGVGWVKIRQQKAPVVGPVCMNVTLIDVTDIVGVTCGDEVIVVGSDDDISVQALCAAAHIPNFRIFLAGLSPAIKRCVIEKPDDLVFTSP